MTETGLKLQEAFSKSGNAIKKKEPLTDVFPRGVTVMYGRSGAGKTVSTVKHLARNGLTPILLDFDDNPPIEDVDYCHLNGAWFIKIMRMQEEQNESHDKRLVRFIANNFIPMQGAGFETPQSARTNYEDFEKYCLPKLDEDKQLEYKELTDKLSEKPKIKKYEDEVFIIDTYHKFITLYSHEKLEKFIEDMTIRNAHVIVISHETGDRGKETGIDEAFVNHCDGRMRLHYDISKKINDVYLIVEKNRSLVGDNKIENWERD